MGSGMCRHVPALLGLCRSRGSKNAHYGILRLRGLLWLGAGELEIPELDIWNKYVSQGSRRGQAYTGKTSSGTKPRVPEPGLFSGDSLARLVAPVAAVYDRRRAC